MKKIKLSKQIIFTLIGILIIVGSIPLTIILVKQKQEIRKEAAGGPIWGRWNTAVTCSTPPPGGGEPPPSGLSCGDSGGNACGTPWSDSCTNLGNTYDCSPCLLCNPQGTYPPPVPIHTGLYCWRILNGCGPNRECPAGTMWREDVCQWQTGPLKGQFDSSKYSWGCDLDPSCPLPTLPTPTPTLPLPPIYTAQCESCQGYDNNWNLITNLSTLTVGQTVYFATQGSTTHPQSITKARFRITVNGVANPWQETTNKRDNEFYIQHTIPSSGSFKIESMVFNPDLGWY